MNAKTIAKQLADAGHRPLAQSLIKAGQATAADEIDEDSRLRIRELIPGIIEAAKHIDRTLKNPRAMHHTLGRLLYFTGTALHFSGKNKVGALCQKWAKVTIQQAGKVEDTGDVTSIKAAAPLDPNNPYFFDNIGTVLAQAVAKINRYLEVENEEDEPDQGSLRRADAQIDVISKYLPILKKAVKDKIRFG